MQGRVDDGSCRLKRERARCYDSADSQKVIAIGHFPRKRHRSRLRNGRAVGAVRPRSVLILAASLRFRMLKLQRRCHFQEPPWLQ